MKFLSLITFVPIIGSVLILLIPKDKTTFIKIISLCCTFVSLIVSLYLLYLFDPSIANITRVSGMQFVERYKWIPIFDIEYFLGIDGLNLPLVFLTMLLFFIGVIVSWNITRSVKGYFILFLFLETGITGAFLSLNFFLFYIFWEIVIIPLYFMVGYWGGEKREYSAIKFFLYMLLGSAVMLVGVLALYFAVEPHSFNFFVLIENNNYSMDFQKWIFLTLLIAFAIRIPLFPFHSWLSDILVEAPSGVGIIISAVFLNMGTYGLLRICFPILPAAAKYFSSLLAFSGAINITYSAFVALAQKDLKRLIAYTNMCHLGFILFGLSAFTSAGFHGAVMHIFNYGIIAAFLIISVEMLSYRLKTRDIDKIGEGLSLKIPLITVITGTAFYGVLSLPGLSTFTSQVMMNIGTFQIYPVLTIIGIGSLIVLAAYFLWIFQHMFFGSLRNECSDLYDITKREIIAIIPLFVITIALGIYPMLFFRLINTTITSLLTLIH